MTNAVANTIITAVKRDENLSWKTHIDHLSKKIASGLGALKRIRSIAPPATLHSVRL